MPSTSRTVEAVVERDGSLRLVDEVELRTGARVLVTIPGETAPPHEPALLSQAALAEDWSRDEEEAAWAHLQEAPRPER